jgi:hypothetical protein
MSFEDIGEQLAPPDLAGGQLVFLTLSDVTLQRTTSQRRVRSAFESFRSKFEFIIVITDSGASNSFATTVLNAADAIVVSLRVGRRKKREDVVLSRRLENMGSRFLGVIALETATITETSSIAPVPFVTSNVRHSPVSQVDTEFRPREVAEWPR